jgi:hypothetical protein
MTALPAVRMLVPPSAEVRAEALARAEAIATGLFPHQVQGVGFLLGRRRSILADDMGLGKTRQSVVALTEAAPQGPWLVVAPASVKRNWAREILAARPADVVHIVGPDAPPGSQFSGWVIVNYDIIARNLNALIDLPWAGLVFDEAHYLKNHTSQRSSSRVPSSRPRPMPCCTPSRGLRSRTALVISSCCCRSSGIQWARASSRSPSDTARRSTTASDG